MIDWAFVKVNKEISFESNVIPHVPKSIGASSYGFKFQYESGDPFMGFSVLTAGEWCCKVDKATGLTAGICNGTRCRSIGTIGIGSASTSRGANLLSPEMTEEYIVIDQPGDHVSRDFANPGDSGSVLIDRFGRLCGLLYGTTYTYGANSSSICRPCYEDVRRFRNDQTKVSPTGHNSRTSLITFNSSLLFFTFTSHTHIRSLGFPQAFCCSFGLLAS